MHIESLKKIIYQDSKYNFIFTDFEYAFTSNHLVGKNAIKEDLYNGYLFLGPHHLFEIGIGVKSQEKTWDVELMKKTRANMPLPSSFAAHNDIFPSNYDITQDFIRLLNDDKNITFLKEPTMPEFLEKLEEFFSQLIKKHDIDYVPNSFSDKIMQQITENYDLNNNEIKSVIFDNKEKGIFHKKIANKLVSKTNIPTTVKKI